MACTRNPLTLAAFLPRSVALDVLGADPPAAVPLLRGGAIVGLLRTSDLRAGSDVAIVALARARPPLVHAGDLLSAALAEMISADAPHAVVVEDGRVVGVLSAEDAVRMLATAAPDGVQPASRRRHGDRNPPTT